MPRNNEPTTRFKVDISELKRGIQEANRQIRLANAEFKAAASGMDDWSKSADGISAKIKQLETVLDGENKKLESLKQQLVLVEREQGANSKGADELRIAIANQQAAVNKTQRALNDYKNKLSELENETEDVNDALRDTDDATKEAGDGFTVLKGILANLAAEGIAKVAGALKDMTTQLLTDSTDAYAQFAAATGTATEAMGEYEEAIKNVYKNNFGESLADVAEKMAKVKEVTGELDASKLQSMTEKAITLEDVFGMDMTETLRGVNGLMDHFGLTSEQAFDLLSSGAQNGLNYTDELGDNVSEYAGKFAEAGFTSDEYFQLLKNGAEGGAYNLDKVNDAINEVTARLADGTIEDSLTSFSDDTQNVFKAWQNGEATQKDVIASIVKDIQNTTGEQEKMNLAALAFGTMAEDGGTQFIEALTPVGDTFDDVTGKAEELANTKYDTPAAKLQTVGRTLQVEVLQPLVEKLVPVLTKIADWVSNNVPNIIKAVEDVVTAVKNVINFIDMISPALAAIGVAIAGLALVGLIQNITLVGAALKTWAMSTKLVTAAQWLLNAAMSANPISLIIIGIAALVAAFAVLWNKSDAFKEFWIGLWEGIKNAFSFVVDWIKENWKTMLLFMMNPLAGVFKYCYDHFEGFRKVVDKVISAVKGFFVSLWEKIVEISTAIWTTIVDVFSPAIEWFSALFTSIWDSLVSIVNVIIGLLKGCWAIIVAVFEIAATWFDDNVIKPVSKLFTALWNAISDAAKTTWDFVSGVFKVVSDWFKDKVIEPVKEVFTGMWDALKTGASNAWEGVKNVFSTVAEFFGDIFSTAWQKVKDVFSVGGQIFSGIKEGIEETFKTVVNTLIQGINKIVTVPFNAINGLLNKIHDIEVAGIEPFKNLWKKDPLSVPQIPELYRGGVLKRGQVGYLEGNGAEAVVPLENNKKWISKTAKDLKQSLRNEGMLTSGGNSANTVNNYNFVQNNTSPKALSRLEIYRQTNNQLNFAKGV